VTHDEALKHADESRRDLERRGATNIEMVVNEWEPGNWLVDGRYSLDVETDPIWGPVVAALHTAMSKPQIKALTQRRSEARRAKLRAKLDGRLLERMGIKSDASTKGLRPNPVFDMWNRSPWKHPAE
jgi:hypothetical protein